MSMRDITKGLQDELTGVADKEQWLRDELAGIVPQRKRLERALQILTNSPTSKKPVKKKAKKGYYVSDDVLQEVEEACRKFGPDDFTVTDLEAELDVRRPTIQAAVAKLRSTNYQAIRLAGKTERNANIYRNMEVNR